MQVPACAALALTLRILTTLIRLEDFDDYRSRESEETGLLRNCTRIRWEGSLPDGSRNPLRMLGSPVAGTCERSLHLTARVTVASSHHSKSDGCADDDSICRYSGVNSCIGRKVVRESKWSVANSGSKAVLWNRHRN